jgi:hypothetical protein
MKNVYLHFIKYTQYQNMFQMEIVELKKIYTVCVTFLRKNGEFKFEPHIK